VTIIRLPRQLVLPAHGEHLAEHGGAIGVRDEELLDGTLAWPLNRASYADPDIAELAALNAMGIARNHPFVDGNKRTAYFALETCLALNGCEFTLSDRDAVIATLPLASGRMTSDEVFTTWVRNNTRSPDA
jgi:death on curing protein